MRRISIAMIFTLLLSLLVGCSTMEESNSESNLPYEIIVENGVSYLIMEEIENKTDNFNAQIDRSIYFASVEEMINDINTGNFSDEELYYLSHYPKDDFGRIRVCNMDELLVPVVPAPLELTGIIWNGQWYTYVLGRNDDDTTYKMLLDTREQHEETIDFDANFASKTTCDVHSQTTEEDRNATVTYYTNLLGKDCKGVYYTVGEGEGTVHVWEDYAFVDEAYKLEYIHIICSDNGVYFHYYSTSETDRPSMEWLSQFGIREYMETEVA